MLRARRRFGGAIIALATLAALLAAMTIWIGSGDRVSADINGMSAAPTTVPAGGTIIITIDADEGDGPVRVIATTGTFTGGACSGVACAGVTPGFDAAPGVDPEVRDITIPDGGNNLNTITISWVAPSTGPATVSFTATQDGTVRTIGGPGTATPTATATAMATATATATGTPSTTCTITPNSPFASGLNAIVVQGSCSAQAASAAIAQSSGRQVLALWVLTSGTWVYFLPQFPNINGGLNQFPGPVASAIVVLS